MLLADILFLCDLILSNRLLSVCMSVSCSLTALPIPIVVKGIYCSSAAIRKTPGPLTRPIGNNIWLWLPVCVCVSVFCLDYANLITTCLDKRWIEASDTKRLTGYFKCERERRTQRRLPAQPPQPQQPILPVSEQNKTCLDLIVCNYCAIAILLHGKASCYI